MGYVAKAIGPNGTEYPIGSSLYGTCSSSADATAKVASVTGFDTLMTGVEVRVKMTNANTAANPTLNISSTGAKAIKIFGSTAVGNTVGTSWNPGEIVSFTYDGTNWVITGFLNTDDIESQFTPITHPEIDEICQTSGGGSGGGGGGGTVVGEVHKVQNGSLIITTSSE